MKSNNIITIFCFALLGTLAGAAQSTGSEKFAVRASANIGLGRAVNLKGDLLNRTSASVNDFGVGFGWRFWQKRGHSLEANIGLGYSASSVTLGMGDFDYNYQAPASADIDGEPYIRYYEVEGLRQKASLGRFIVPVYLSYGFQCNKWLGVHTDVGVQLGFKVSSKLTELTGSAYSNGVYPQYDNLKIDEAYMNDFGRTGFTKAMGTEPAANGFTCSVIAGVRAEFWIYGPLAADLSFRYTGGLTDLYKSEIGQPGNFDSVNSPVTYSVAGGQRVRPLTDYLTSSKLSRLSVQVSLLCRF